MVLMYVKLNNVYTFNGFELNFSYPRRIAHSTIPHEHLHGFPNFRYKKLNIIMGNNATGKTVLGKLLDLVFKAITDADISYLYDVPLLDKTKEGMVSIDFVPDGENLYRMIFKIDRTRRQRLVGFDIVSTKITKRDNYETAAKRLDKQKLSHQDDISEIKRNPKIKWHFFNPEHVKSIDTLHVHKGTYLKVLSIVLKTLDPSIKDILSIPSSHKHKGENGAFMIRFNNHDGRLWIDDRGVTNGKQLSTGTEAGIHIASMISSIIENTGTF